MEIILNNIIQESLPDGPGHSPRTYSKFHSISDPYILISPALTFSKDRNLVFFDFPHSEESSFGVASMSAKTSEIIMKKNDAGYDMDKMVHDFTFGCLTQTTDVPLSTLIPQTRIPSHLKHLLRKTPDYLADIEGRICMVEFGTCSSFSEERLRQYYDVKMNVYEQVAHSLQPYLIDQNIDVFVIIVGPSGIYTNMMLSDDLMSVLVYRFKLAKQVDQDLITSGLKILPIDKKINSNARSFMQLLSSFSVEGLDEYSLENYERLIYSDHDAADLARTLRHAWKSSMDYVIDRDIWEIGRNGNRKEYSDSRIALAVAKHVEECDKLAPEGYSDHMKSIVNVPFIVLNSSAPTMKIKDSKFMLKDITGHDSDEVLRLWIGAKRAIEEDDHFIDNSEEHDAYSDVLPEEDPIIDLIDGMDALGPKPSDVRNLYCRVKIEVSNEDRIELAKVGVEGKKLDEEGDPTVKAYRKSRQLPFSILTNVSDFDNLFWSDLHWMIKPVASKNNERVMANRLSLIENAVNIHEDNKLTDQYRKTRKELATTPLIQWSCMVSDIAFELCLALRQGCKKGVFIIKKLKDWECYILIKPVRLSSKIFFSLLWFDEDVIVSNTPGTVFREPRSNGVVSWTEFVSLDQNKIENWALCESRTFSMIPYWLEFHGLPPHDIYCEEYAESVSLTSALQMMLLYTCIELADKSEIEQEASLFRYMFMKSLTSEPLIPEPELVIEDFKKQVRSRLTIWIQQRLITYCLYVAQGKITIMQEELELHDSSLSTLSNKRLVWRGLVNPYNMARLNSPGDAVNLMYIGYVQNKNLQPEANVFGKMLEKILVLEDDFTNEIKSRIGRENKPLGQDTKHEYNIDLLKAATNYAKNTYLRKLHGEGALETRIEEIMSNIANTHLEDVFTTLKASSNFSEKFFQLTEEEYHRLKVIEKVQSYVHGDKTRVADILLQCFEEVKNNGYMRIDIFQKNQHGGIREIYVLGFAERVVQWVIETISRGLCAMFPGETMTHPENKKRLPEEYFKNVRMRSNGKPTMTFCTSADASKWSQNMYSHKFAIMLCLLLPEYMHGFLWQSLSFWKNKYIMIPQSLIRRFHERDDLQLYNKYMRGLYGAYKGKEERTWASKDQAFIKVSTGMMQGILHYTSSLFHSIMNVYTESITMWKFSDATGLSLQPLILQSSDDSCEILTCEIPETQKEKAVVLFTLAICQVFKAHLGEEVGIKDSKKKTSLHTNFTFEFNSSYNFGPSTYEADGKLLSSALICTDRENIVDRHMEQYTQLTNFINAGGSIYSAHFIQSAQALFNYRLMGSSVTSRFRVLAAAYKVLPDPNLGFFLMDNPLFTGLSGYKYNLWKAIIKTKVGITYKYYLNNALDFSSENKEPDLLTTGNGILAKRAVLNFGNRQKLLNLIKRMELPEEWQDLIDNDPSLVFRKSENEDEFKIICSMKMHSPGVQESLSTGNVTTRIMASSAYITLSTVMKTLGEWQKTSDMDLNADNPSGRFNMVQLIQKEMKILLSESEPLSDNELSFLFPFHEEYMSLDARLAACDYFLPKRKNVEYRRVTTSVRIYERDNITALSPDRIMSALWFQDDDRVPKPKYPLKYLKKCYLDLRKSIPWLSDDLHKTLRDGPFKHVNGLAAWLTQFHQKDKVVVIIGAPVVCRRGSSSILAVIRQNFHKFFQLTNIVKDDHVTESTDYIYLKQALLLTLSFPMSKKDAERRISSLLRSETARSLKYNGNAEKSRYNLLCIMRDALDTQEPMEILEKISESKLGIVGGYTMPQMFDKKTMTYYGPGIWVGKFFDRRVRLEVDSYNSSENDESPVYISYLKKIYISDLYPLDDILFCLRTWCEENWIQSSGPEVESHYTRTPAIRYSRRAGLIGGAKTYYSKGKFSDDERGTPVIVDENIENHLGDLVSFELDVPMDESFSRGVIKLMGVYRKLSYRSGKRVTLARYVVNHRDYFGATTSRIGIIMPAAGAAWIKNEPMSVELARKTIEWAMNDDCDLSLSLHVKDVLKNTFARKGLKLGRKRDEIQFVKKAHDLYIEEMSRRGLNYKSKVVRMPNIREVFEKPAAKDNSKDTKTVTWAEDLEQEFMSSQCLEERVKVMTEEELDRAFNMGDPTTSEEGVIGGWRRRMEEVKRFLGLGSDVDSAVMGEEAKETLDEARALISNVDPSIIKPPRSLDDQERSKAAVGEPLLRDESESEHGSGSERLEADPDETSSNNTIGEQESNGEDDGDSDDDIDWGDEDDEDERVREHFKRMKESSEEYEEVLRYMVEQDKGPLIIEPEAHEIMRLDSDFEHMNTTDFFRDLELINSSDYRVSLSMTETNSRNSMVKKDHIWFQNWVNTWFSEHSHDLVKLFHHRILSDKLEKNGFIRVMEFMYPGLEFKKEEEVISFKKDDGALNPFEEEED